MCSVECNALCVHGDLLRKHAQNVNGNETKRPTADFADADGSSFRQRAATALRLVVVLSSNLKRVPSLSPIRTARYTVAPYGLVDADSGGRNELRDHTPRAHASDALVERFRSFVPWVIAEKEDG